MMNGAPILDEKLRTAVVGRAMRQGFIVAAIVFVVLTAIQLTAYVAQQNFTHLLINIVVIPNAAGGAWFWWKRKQFLDAVANNEREIIRILTG